MCERACALRQPSYSRSVPLIVQIVARLSSVVYRLSSIVYRLSSIVCRRLHTLCGQCRPTHTQNRAIMALTLLSCLEARSFLKKSKGDLAGFTFRDTRCLALGEMDPVLVMADWNSSLINRLSLPAVTHRETET